jgi:hypothetical protein
MNEYNYVQKVKDSIQQKFTKPSPEFMAILDQQKEAGTLSAKNHKKARKFMSKLLDISFQNFRGKFKNKALEDFVTNANSLQFTDENNDNIIQKKDPNYLDPYDNDGFKSHFYAPKKKIFGIYIDTFWANLIVIWSMTIFLTLTLFADAFKKLLDLLGRVGELLPKKKMVKKEPKKVAIAIEKDATKAA